jgi:hypothetical protein
MSDPHQELGYAHSVSIAATLAGAIVMLANMAQWAAIFGGGQP